MYPRTLVRNIPVFVLAESKSHCELDGVPQDFRALCFTDKRIFTEVIATGLHTWPVLTANVAYQYKASTDSDYSDDNLVGSFESEMELSEFGLDDAEIEAFINTLPVRD
jgi:hypothetical protein